MPPRPVPDAGCVGAGAFGRGLAITGAGATTFGGGATGATVATGGVGATGRSSMGSPIDIVVGAGATVVVGSGAGFTVGAAFSVGRAGSSVETATTAKPVSATMTTPTRPSVIRRPRLAFFSGGGDEITLRIGGRLLMSCGE